MYQVIWSPLAFETYLATIDFILLQWPVRTAIDFENKVNDLIDKLKIHRYLCPPSEIALHLRRCVITKQTSMIYEVKGDFVEILAFFDNRSGMKF